MGNVSWEDAKAKSGELIAGALPFDAQSEEDFQRKDGLYVLVYCGTQLGGSLWEEPSPRIVYVGHTGNDSLRHWKIIWLLVKRFYRNTKKTAKKY